MIDESTEFGARVARRLRDERIVWLTTVRADGRPEPSPVWFLWDGETILIYSKPETVKVRNITKRPRVSIHFNADYYGSDVVVLSGEARIASEMPLADRVPALLEKYRENLDVPGSISTEQFVREYSLAITVTPTALRGF